MRGRQRGITGSGQDMAEREGVESEGRQRGITGSGQDMAEREGVESEGQAERDNGEWTRHG